jgi:2-polyprenyl-6-methoxyphenol hydroxylase-like FAD-dependent oxidoreductase
MEVIIIGAGIGGLTLGLMLHKAGISFRIHEAAPEIRPIGVGITILPHANKELGALGVLDAMLHAGVVAKESCFYTRHGQLVHKEAVGTFAGYAWPQVQIHRGDLQQILYRALIERAGADSVVTGQRCVRVEDGADFATAHCVDSTGAALPPVRARTLVAADGIHSVVRRQFYPDEGAPIYSGVNMWRGVTVARPFLTGQSYMRGGWLTHGKMVIYPIRNHADGTQLINWVAEIETPRHDRQDWNQAGRLEDFIGAFEAWRWDFLDVPALIRGASEVLEYPMVDRDPLPRWNFGHITLLGDAAHPMYPRGSNGAGQAILDARCLTDCLAAAGDVHSALRTYESSRLPATAAVVRTNRSGPPDAILREVYERSGDKPFADINDIITPEEITAMMNAYKKVAGYDRASLETRR